METAKLYISLPFDEGQGNTVMDAAGVLPECKIQYRFNNAKYMPSQDPQWRKGIRGNCLLFDGSSNYLSYPPETVKFPNGSFSITLWVAPRCFEWDDPLAPEKGTAVLTGLVGQHDRGQKTGFILGYHRHGRLAFQFGTGEEWITLWGELDKRLEALAWNHIALTVCPASGQANLYLNGVCIGSYCHGGSFAIAPAHTPLHIGWNEEDPVLRHFGGYLDELAVYTGVLTPEQVQAEYPSVLVPPIAYSEIGLQSDILTKDIHKPQFHIGPYQHWMNEGHAPLFYNGHYHLFFQHNMAGPYWHNISWGHWESPDLVHWQQLADAITPKMDTVAPDGIWSGGATFDANGVPLLFFTAGNDNFRRTPGLISNQNVGVAYPEDLSDPYLTRWHVYEELAVVQVPGQGRPGEFRDSHIWKENGTWYMLVCSGSLNHDGGCILLYATDTLELLPNGKLDMNWQYRGVALEMPAYEERYGHAWELPICFPLTNADGSIRKYYLSISPAPGAFGDGKCENNIFYYLGDFDLAHGKFLPDERFHGYPDRLDYGKLVSIGPCAFLDPNSGDMCLFSILNSKRTSQEQDAAGWSHCLSVARRICLTNDGTDITVAPMPQISSLEKAVLVDKESLTLQEANALLASVREDMLHIRLTLENRDAHRFGLRLREGSNGDWTAYTYDTATQTIHGDSGNTPVASGASGKLSLEDGALDMEILADRSVIEGYFNNRKALAMLSYADAESRGLRIVADGGVVVRRLYVASMNGIYPTGSCR